ncbi:MAG: bifunctional precorrin-2 dehydrogenase/sirohydrochlorin ferrochelatase [Caldilineaceae bacterium]
MADSAENNESPQDTAGDVYPILLTGLSHKLAIVVGGGPVGERKVAGLLAAQARVRLISPTATPLLQQRAQAGMIGWQQRPYQPGDLTGAFLVFAATNVREINALVAHDAACLGLLCNVADAPAEGNFHVPALHWQGDFVVAVGSRQGSNPKRVKQLRDRIAQFLADFDIFP